MNCDGELFMNFSSWTNNASILWTFHELFMNVHECSWTVHKVMNYISPGLISDFLGGMISHNWFYLADLSQISDLFANMWYLIFDYLGGGGGLISDIWFLGGLIIVC